MWQMKFYPYEKGSGRFFYSHAERGGTSSSEVVSTWELEVLVILKWAYKMFPSFKRGGGGANSFGPAVFPFCSTPLLPLINDRSLIR